jgi:tryptophan-rich sensory protein
MNNLVRLILSIIICQAAGAFGALAPSGSENAWYNSLAKPSFTPPDSVFAPVWITLYFLMGIALFLVWREGLKNKEVKSAFILFMVQLFLNAFWSHIFFGAQSVLGAFILLLVLIVLIVLTIIKFFKISRLAGMLLIPYLLWVLFAAALNFVFWQLNQ